AARTWSDCPWADGSPCGSTSCTRGGGPRSRSAIRTAGSPRSLPRSALSTSGSAANRSMLAPSPATPRPPSCRRLSLHTPRPRRRGNCPSAVPPAAPGARQQLLESMAALRKTSYLRSLEATVNQDTVGNLAAIAVPTHFVVGEHDRLTTVALARAMTAEVPGAELTVIPDAGHLSNIENVEVFNRSVMDFLMRHPGADAPHAPAVAGSHGQRGP